MADILLLNKPYNVLCQFSDKQIQGEQQRKTLADFIPKRFDQFYPAGRLDLDSEGLVVLTDNGALQHQITHPKNKMPKTYWVQVEGLPTEESLNHLRRGIQLKDGMTRPAKVDLISEPRIWPRVPPIRERKKIPTAWLSITISEGRNRQVRRMTSAVELPTLRLIRASIGIWSIENISLGKFVQTTVHLAKSKEKK